MSIWWYFKLSTVNLLQGYSSTVQVAVGGAGGGAARVQYCKLVCQAGGWKGPYCSHQPSHDLTLPGRSPLV